MFLRTIPAAATAILALGLAGCSDYTTVEPRTTEPATPAPTYSQDPLEGALQPQKLYERHQLLEDGRDVTCLATETALSCDWAGALTKTIPAEDSPAPAVTPRG